MQTSELVGIWELESRAGNKPVEDGIKTALIKFRTDGTFVDATEVLSPCPGFVPERIHRLKETWKLDANILERTFPEGSFPETSSSVWTHKSVVAVNDDSLEIAAHQYEREAEREYVSVSVYKRVDMT